jgi:hypothetical protein
MALVNMHCDAEKMKWQTHQPRINKIMDGHSNPSSFAQYTSHLILATKDWYALQFLIYQYKRYAFHTALVLHPTQWRTQEFCSEGGSTNSVEDRGQREWGSGGNSPLVRGSAQFAIWFDFVKLSGCRGLLQIYFPRNWEFGSALSKLQNFRGGVWTPKPPPRYVIDVTYNRGIRKQKLQTFWRPVNYTWCQDNGTVTSTSCSHSHL